MEIVKSIKQDNALSGNGTPAGSVTPNFIGQTYIDTATGSFYYSTGLTNADWSTTGGIVKSVGSKLYLFYNY